MSEAIDKGMVSAYLKVRRFYAEQDVRLWMRDHGIDPDASEDLEELVIRYDAWQGDNPFWYEAIGDFASEMGVEG